MRYRVEAHKVDSNLPEYVRWNPRIIIFKPCLYSGEESSRSILVHSYSSKEGAIRDGITFIREYLPPGDIEQE